MNPSHYRGRGAGVDPPNRHETRHQEIEADELERTAQEHPDGVRRTTRVVEDRTRSILTRVTSPDLPFAYTLNPYRGCEHGCSYCYARPGHEDLGYSAGVDFESIIVAKKDAPRLLRQELRAPKWRGEVIALSGSTDAWQPLERDLEITRACLEILAEARQAVSIITKGALILRDLDLLRELASHGAVAVGISITTLDTGLAHALEPRAATPVERLRTIAALTEAGIPTAVMVAPVIPGLTEHEMPQIIEQAAAAGAGGAGWTLLRLPGAVEFVFLDWLAHHRPDSAAAVERRLRARRGGKTNDSRYGRRHVGEGEAARQFAQLFDLMRRRHGLEGRMHRPDESAFRPPRPGAGEQLDLFADG